MSDQTTYSVLYRVDSPQDLKNLTIEELETLCAEVRNFIIDASTQNPGHLAANLGVVELTVALHRVFNTPYDRIIFDVGHQAYTHKILTGRRDQFKTIRKYHGISGFPSISESEYDAFGVGHASTSVSAALGMAMSSKMLGETDRQIVAVIGDGALAGGMAFEALNNAGASNADMLVILNDNRMAIDPSVGALSEYLLNISTSRMYNRIKDKAWKILGNSLFRRSLQRVQKGMKATVIASGNLFESLKFRYFGPIDGHDVRQLVKVLEDMKRIPGPKLLHILTKKGKGYPFAEQNQTLWHAPREFDKETGRFIRHDESAVGYHEVFGQTLVELAIANDRIVAVTPAMARGCGMHYMQQAFPDRTFDVGIAEQHAVTFSAGMASQGMLPFCNVYSTFMQRAYDQIIHDVALQKLPVVLCLDRAGLVGPDGATHHGTFDLASLRCVPNLIIAAPSTAETLRNMMYTASEMRVPFVLRYPKREVGTGAWKTPFRMLPIGQGVMLQEGEEIALLMLGALRPEVEAACARLADSGIRPAVADMQFLKPIDETLLHRLCQTYRHLVTIEDGTIIGGLGSAVMEFVQDHGYNVSVSRLGIPDRFILHGTRDELTGECGYDAEGICREVRKIVDKA